MDEIPCFELNILKWIYCTFGNNTQIIYEDLEALLVSKETFRPVKLFKGLFFRDTGMFLG